MCSSIFFFLTELISYNQDRFFSGGNKYCFSDSCSSPPKKLPWLKSNLRAPEMSAQRGGVFSSIPVLMALWGSSGGVITSLANPLWQSQAKRSHQPSVSGSLHQWWKQTDPYSSDPKHQSRFGTREREGIVKKCPVSQASSNKFCQS